MANTLGGINLAQIADKTIAYLKYEFFPITAFATDFSEDVKDKGESVTTRIVSSVTASDLSSGYTPSDVTSTAVKVDLDQFFGPVVEFTDKEMSYAGDPEWLRQQFVEPMVEGLLDKIMQTAFALVVNANFTNNDVIAAANFDSDDVATIRGKLTKLKVSQKNRAMILDPDWYTALIKDSVVEDASAFGDNMAIKEGVIRRIRGFDVYEYANIPGNAENLAGFAAHRSAVAIAARTVVDPTEIDGQAPLDVVNRVDQVTGLPLQFRQWYSPDGGACRFSIGTLWGVKKAQGNSLHRILSA